MWPLSIHLTMVVGLTNPIFFPSNLLYALWFLFWLRWNLSTDHPNLAFWPGGHNFIYQANEQILQFWQWVKQKLESIYVFTILDCVNFILTILAWIFYFAPV